MKENWIQYFKPPFYYDAASGFIFDQEGQTPAEVRAWGMLQYKPNGDKVQDAMGHDIAKGLNMVLCDATTDDKNGEADPQINPDPLGNGELEDWVATPLEEKPLKDGWYCIEARGAVPLIRWYDSENGWDIAEAEYGYKHWLKKK